jgi:hypothetical protein
MADRDPFGNHVTTTSTRPRTLRRRRGVSRTDRVRAVVLALAIVGAPTRRLVGGHGSIDVLAAAALALIAACGLLAHRARLRARGRTQTRGRRSAWIHLTSLAIALRFVAAAALAIGFSRRGVLNIAIPAAASSLTLTAVEARRARRIARD